MITLVRKHWNETAQGAFLTNGLTFTDALNQDLLLETLQKIVEGKITQVQLYDYVKNAPKEGQFVTIYPADVILFEGILAFYFPQVRDLFNMKLFVDTDPDTRLYRRVMRDVEERGRELEVVLNHYMDFVKPSFEEFCLPVKPLVIIDIFSIFNLLFPFKLQTKKFADVIIPRGSDNTGNSFVAGFKLKKTSNPPFKIQIPNALGSTLAIFTQILILHSNLPEAWQSGTCIRLFYFSIVAISLIVQHIQEVMNVRSGNNAGTSPTGDSGSEDGIKPRRVVKRELSRPH